MNPREYLVVADELLHLGGAARNRSAISRAYYAAFNVGAETLRMLGFPLGKGAAGHGEVARGMANSGDAATILAAQRLSELHTNRIRADYQLELTDVEDPARARRLISDANSIIESFNRILSSAQRVAIQSAIAAWRKSNGYP